MRWGREGRGGTDGEIADGVPDGLRELLGVFGRLFDRFVEELVQDLLGDGGVREAQLDYEGVEEGLVDGLEGAPVEGVFFLLGLRILGDVEVLAIVTCVVQLAVILGRIVLYIQGVNVATQQKIR